MSFTQDLESFERNVRTTMPKGLVSFIRGGGEITDLRDTATGKFFRSEKRSLPYEITRRIREEKKIDDMNPYSDFVKLRMDGQTPQLLLYHPEKGTYLGEYSLLKI